MPSLKARIKTSTEGTNMNQEQLTLHHYWRSSCSWRVRWALEYKKIPYGKKHVNLLKAEQKEEAYLKINPTWIRYIDYNTNPETIFEITF